MSHREQPVAFNRVSISDPFFAPRMKINREKTLPAEYRQCKETGRIGQLELNWKPGKPAHTFWDSDVHKWLEAACLELQNNPDPELRKKVDEVAGLIAAAQQPDGYLHSYYTSVQPELRWKNLRDNHELYTMGHFFEAAVAHHQATGTRLLLDVASRCVDLIASVFGTGPGQKRGYCGHEEIELALIKLYRHTGEAKYLNLCQYFIDQRGQQPNYFEAEDQEQNRAVRWPVSYAQAHAPVREQTEVTGHAVRATYLYCGMADLARETNDESLLRASEKLWQHATSARMYLTGGFGNSAHNEGFTSDYDLPNENAYCETCAAIGLALWSHRMLLLDCDSRYADVVERTLYNGVVSGVSLSGDRFFYENPLASTGSHHRKEWFGCACCPPNIARILASLGQFVYTQGNSATVHLYVQGSGKLEVNGQPVAIQQTTNYPWDGRIALAVEPAKAAKFELKLRIPGWCSNYTVRLNGSPLSAEQRKGYLVVDREWRAGDKVELDFAMPVTRVYSTPRLRFNCGRVALQRGPVVYCLEGCDNGSDLNALTLPRESTVTTNFEAGLLGGVLTLSGQAQRLSSNGTLYGTQPPSLQPARFKAVPYCVWDNREPGEMLVWLRE